jgi:gamma-glutamyl:cysteine ligase YbdK (ATP-grasp superfamily)
VLHFDARPQSLWGRHAPKVDLRTMSMIDRVAHAIYAAAPRLAISGAPLAWDDLEDETRSDYRVAARKAIAAMRIPTDAMLDAGDRRDLSRDAANIWERMMFTAISEPE